THGKHVTPAHPYLRFPCRIGSRPKARKHHLERSGSDLMRTNRKVTALIALAAAGALALSACSSSKSSGSGGTGSNGGGSGGASGYNAANTGIVTPSGPTSGVVKYALSSTPDSFDPGNTYYAFVWDASRLWASALTTFEPQPGNASLKLVPNL